MPHTKPQAVSGVSSGEEAVVDTRYPSVACTWLGRLLGWLYELIPLKINGIKLSHILFCLPTAPIGALIYLLLKIFGSRYVLTNRSLERRGSLTGRLVSRVALTDVARIDVTQTPGQVFFRAGDIELVGSGEDVLMRMSGIPRPEVFRHTILEVRDAHLRAEASLETIRARHAE